MDSRLQEHAPQARCYECGSAEITRMCHHCARIGCSKHIAPIPTVAGRPLSREMSRLGMGRKLTYHCADCVHIASPTTLLVCGGGAVVLLAGLGVLWIDLVVGLIFTAAGAGLAAVSYGIGVRKRAGKARLPLPVLPRVEEISLREELRGQIYLRPDGNYESLSEPVEGKITTIMAFGPSDRQRLGIYLRRERTVQDSDVKFNVGSLVLRGPAGISLSANFPRLVIPLEGTTSGYAIFDAGRQRASSFFRAEHVYHLMPGREVSKVPISITPAIAPRSDRRALELQIQWGDMGEPGARLALEKVESLKLRVPERWGHVEGASRPVVVNPKASEEGDQVLRAVEWAHLLPTKEECISRRLEFVVQFEEKITTQGAIYGRLDAVFDKAISGIQGLRFIGPLGSIRHYPTAHAVKTHVLIDFELSLAGTRYQDIRLIPDRERPEDLARSESDEYPGVIPDSETVVTLTNALSDDCYYIKRVIENPPRSGARANLLRRYWDIAGRRYEGVYPIDFHIILTGEEIHHGGIRAHSGRTKTRLTVQGSYANPDMLELVEQVWERLHLLMTETLQSPLCAGKTKGGLSDPANEWLRSANGHENATGSNGAGPRRAPRNSARFLELLGLLDEALLHGRISDERYWEMRERAERQLDGG